jgi:mannose-1-phosphate guanylyltransferase
MRAVVLVGGFGTRLRPLTYTTPKPMLPVCHRPVIEHLIAGLARGGVTEVTLALGFKPETFTEAYPDGTCAGVTLRYAVEPEPLDTAGAIRFAAEQSGIDDTFVVVNGDVLTDLDVAALVSFHRAHGAEATVHLIPVADPSAFGVVETDAEGHVLSFVEKPAPGEAPSNLVNAGTYVLETSVLDRIGAGRKVSIEREVFPQLVEAGTLFAMPSDVYWVDTGKPEIYRQANLDLLDGRRASALPVVGVHPDALVAASAQVEHSVVGPGARVEEGATVRDSVLLPDAIVERDADVTASIVAGRVGAGASLLDVVVGAEGVVAAGATLHGVSVPEVT